MTESISYSGGLVSLLLPWFLGCVWVRWLLCKSGRWNWFIVAGQGYLVGIFLTTLTIRFADWAGLGLHFWPLAACLSLLGIAALAVQMRQISPSKYEPITAASPHWHKAIVVIMLLLLSWRYVTLLQEILLRPLYAWDAWMNWVPKAIVWFHLGELVDFVNPNQWLLQGREVQSYTLGNRQASEYPPTVPLILLWGMMGIGSWDHSFLHLPWLLLAINLGLALYGHLRLTGSSVLGSAIASYMLLGLPFYNVHTVLAGYADIWLAAAFGMSVFAFREWHLNRAWPYGLLCLVTAALCSQLKIPGIVLALILLVAFLRSLVNASYNKEILLLSSLAAISMALLLFGLDIQIPAVGRLVINTDVISLPLFGEHSLHFHPVWSAFLESMFVMINWHLGWYLFFVLLLTMALRGRFSRQPAPDTFAIIAALLFLFFVFFFTDQQRAATNFVTLNRAQLYVVPALFYYLFLQLNAQERVSGQRQ
ncbi:MAG: hypothetical protein IPG64_22540 [Haliea sp.]|nr:hypothetical protein [Haliea sp.]